MKSLDEIIKGLKMVQISNEVLYSISDLKKTLLLLEEGSIHASDCTITPNYVSGGKRLELYEYEFDCAFVENEDFECYLQHVTGKKGVDIPAIIRERKKICHVELLKGEQFIDKVKIQDYISYINDQADICKQIVSQFGQFDKDKLYFEYFTI